MRGSDHSSRPLRPSAPLAHPVPAHGRAAYRRRAPPAPDTPDHLTGLAPRACLENRLRAWQHHSQRAGRQSVSPPALVLVDVIGLTIANEQGGFSAGDALIRAAAGRLLTAARSAGCVARLGGDELVALFTGLSAGQRAQAAALSLQQSAAQPLLRAGWIVAEAAETPAHLLDRLYRHARSQVDRAGGGKALPGRPAASSLDGIDPAAE